MLRAERTEPSVLSENFTQELSEKANVYQLHNGHPAILHSSPEFDPAPSKRLVLKIAESKEELEACFSVLHDAYVESGFMRPDPSGMRVTLYHALPSTTTLCAKYDGRVVGTVSLIRQNALGFPLQSIFDLSAVREKGGQIAEVSALAIHSRFRRTGGSILFPLLKLVCEYCETVVNVRHLVIAINPRHIEIYESMLFFRRLTMNVVENYDFANGAAAVGATLDIWQAKEDFREHYDSKPASSNLYAYFTQLKLPNIELPECRADSNEAPTLTPELLDYFFNVRTRTFDNLPAHTKAILHAIYHRPEYRDVLPPLASRMVRVHEKTGGIGDRAMILR